MIGGVQYPSADVVSNSSVFQNCFKFSQSLKGRGFSPAVPVARIWALAPEGTVRAKREPARHNHQTYFVTFQAMERKAFFRNERWAELFLSVLVRYRKEFALHDFVVMHDHVHLLVTPNGALERPIGLVKGGYSFYAKREFSWNGEIWQPGFSDHRIRDANDWDKHIAYIRKNVSSLKQPGYKFCGENAGIPLDAAPQWLKPHNSGDRDGGAEAPPLQNGSEVPPVPSGSEAQSIQSVCEATPLQSILESKDS